VLFPTMSKPLREGPWTFTRERMATLAQRHPFQLGANGRHPFEYHPKHVGEIQRDHENGEKSVTYFPGEAAQRKLFMALAKKYMANATSLATLDEIIFNDVMELHFWPRIPQEEVFENASNILQRLPAVPVEFHDPDLDVAYDELPEAYFSDKSNHLWENLKASQYVSSVILGTVMTSTNGSKFSVMQLLEDVYNTNARILEAALTISESVGRFSIDCFVVKTFLWSISQHTLMLRNYSRLGLMLEVGYRTDDLWDQALEGSNKLESAFYHSLLHQKDDEGVPKYMCKWALKLLKKNHVTLALDFRYFLYQYSVVFGKYESRCLYALDGSSRQCEGNAPTQCNRFVGRKIEDQSAHSRFCSKPCPRLFWDETSYRAIEEGQGRAVCVFKKENNLLQYCPVTEFTIAISHVWSHGQGGRPELGETGMNNCLHERYSRIAHSQQCNSYWMDTPCIPSEHVLRKEAIRQINPTFAKSKLTLVCDMDLMEIDISEPSITIYEQLLTTLLVCDWNVRAWTLLEAMRGRRNLHLLCKDDSIISLIEILQGIHLYGRIDLGILAIESRQLMPAIDIRAGRPWNRMKGDKDYNDPDLIVEGITDPFDAASLLSHRHASRPGDNIVIWSLICSRSFFDDASSLWINAILPEDRPIPTGFLISSLPRIQKEGLSWAPSRPDLPLVEVREKTKQFPAFGSVQSRLARAIWSDCRSRVLGIRAVWLKSLIKRPRLRDRFSLPPRSKISFQAKPKSTNDTIQEISSKILVNYNWGALLRPVFNRGATDFGDLFEDIDGYIPFDYEGDSEGPLLVIVGSNDGPIHSKYRGNNKGVEAHDGIHWNWIGIFEWKDSVPLPTFKPEFVIIA